MLSNSSNPILQCKQSTADSIEEAFEPNTESNLRSIETSELHYTQLGTSANQKNTTAISANTSCKSVPFLMTKEEHIMLSRNNCNGKITGTGNDL